MGTSLRIRWGRRIIVIIVLCAAIAKCISLVESRLNSALFGRVDASRKALALPENYKPAAIALARLAQTDPALLKEGADGTPPEWTPQVLGKLGPLEITIQNDGAYLTTTSGLAEFTGYKVELDKSKSSETTNQWVLTLSGISEKDEEVYQFTLSKTDQFTEEELVRDALVELDRRKAARAAGTNLAISNDFDDPDLDRRRLLFDHPSIAKRLGLEVPSAAATQPVAAP